MIDDIVGKPKVKRLLGRPRRREREWGGVNWIHLAQDMDTWRANVYTIIYIRDP